MPNLESVWIDLRFAMRGLLRNPVFSLSATAAAALGIGTTTAVFSVVDRILFRPLPYAHEARLASVGMMTPLDSNEFMFASQYFDLRSDPGPFEAVASFQAGAGACDLSEQSPVRLRCLWIEANFLETLGLRPLLGRTFSADEDSSSGPRAGLISFGLWRNRFAGAADVLGRTVMIDGVPIAIVGVMPKTFEMPNLATADVFLPMRLNEATERQGRALRVFGRLKPGITQESAFAQLQPNFARALETVPKQFRKEVSLRVRPIRDRQVGEAKMASMALLGAVIAALLIACANIANLLLARAVARDRELAMRAALGASRARLAQQAVTESVLLGALGGAAGCALAYALLRAFIALSPGGLPRLEEATLDTRVLLFAAGASIASGLLFGITPALRVPEAAMIGGWRVAGSRHRNTVRALLVTLQIAISIMLLSGASLMLRSLWKLQSVPLGMDAEHVLTARFTLGQLRYSRPVDQLNFFRELELRLAELPGLQSAAISDSLPPSGGARGRPLSAIEVQGRPKRPEGTGGMVTWRFVTPDYFKTLGIPITRGRGFSGEDRSPEALSMVISETLAKVLFPGEDPVGRYVLKGPKGEWFTVIGVAGDVKNAGRAASSAPEYYVVRKATSDFTFQNAEPPNGWRDTTVIVRTTLEPTLMSSAVRGVIASIDATIPVDTQTMEQNVDGTSARPRFIAALLSVFAATGVLLAAIGLYGVMSFLVSQRTKEIGVRMAIGATPRQIMRQTLGLALRWTLAGLVLGVAGSIVEARLITPLLFEVKPSDPIALGAAVVVLCVVALLAALVPAGRAARLDPMVALRQE